MAPQTQQQPSIRQRPGGFLSVPLPSPAPSRLSLREAEATLTRLVRLGWSCLPLAGDDPLNLLYDDHPAREWTLGWDPEDPALWLLVWEKTSWRKRCSWILYRNGTKRLTCEDLPLSTEAALCRLLWESPGHPYRSPADFLGRLVDYTLSPAQRQHHGHLLLRTFQANPAAWAALREAFYALLERDLTRDDWPTLDLLKIHRLDQKILLLQILAANRQKIDQEEIDREEMDRIQDLTDQIEDGYERLGERITVFMRPEYEHSYRRFCQARLTFQALLR